jgi:hypothetical protein
MYYDRPSLEELIDAACQHLELQVIPVVKGDAKLYFQTLVAINVLKIAIRQATLEEQHTLAAWSGMNALTESAIELPAYVEERRTALQQRSAHLCSAIRRGDFDQQEERMALLYYVKHVTAAQLEVANPKFLQGIAQEEQLTAAD